MESTYEPEVAEPPTPVLIFLEPDEESAETAAPVCEIDGTCN